MSIYTNLQSGDATVAYNQCIYIHTDVWKWLVGGGVGVQLCSCIIHTCFVWCRSTHHVSGRLLELYLWLNSEFSGHLLMRPVCRGIDSRRHASTLHLHKIPFNRHGREERKRTKKNFDTVISIEITIIILNRKINKYEMEKKTDRRELIEVGPIYTHRLIDAVYYVAGDLHFTDSKAYNVSSYSLVLWPNRNLHYRYTLYWWMDKIGERMDEWFNEIWNERRNWTSNRVKCIQWIILRNIRWCIAGNQWRNK